MARRIPSPEPVPMSGDPLESVGDDQILGWLENSTFTPINLPPSTSEHPTGIRSLVFAPHGFRDRFARLVETSTRKDPAAKIDALLELADEAGYRDRAIHRLRCLAHNHLRIAAHMERLRREA